MEEADLVSIFKDSIAHLPIETLIVDSSSTKQPQNAPAPPRPEVQRNFDEMMKFVTSGPMPIGHTVPLENHAYFLASTLKFYGIESVSTKKDLIDAAAREAKATGQVDYASFKAVLAEKVRQHLLRAKLPFFVVLPLNVRPQDFGNRRFFTVQDVRFGIRTWQQLGKRFAITEWRKKATRRFEEDEAFFMPSITPLLVNTSAATDSEALLAALNAFDLLRAVFAFPMVVQSFQEHFGHRPKPLGKICASSVYAVFHPDGSLADEYTIDPIPHYYRGQKLPADHLRYVDYWLRDLKKSEGQTQTTNMLMEALRLYGRALETPDFEKAFLLLWQTLELITSKSIGQFGNDAVIKRVGVLVQEHPVLTDLLKLSHDSRNTLVHRGRFPDDQMLAVNVLKQVVDVCLLNLDALRRQYSKWEELEMYYTLSLSPRLEEQVKVIQSIQRMKAKRAVNKKISKKPQ